MPRLSQWHGDHIATVDIDELSALPVHRLGLNRKRDTLDQPLRFADGVGGGRFVFCVNAKEPIFTQPCFLVFEVSDESGDIGLYLGIAPKDQPRRPSNGITLLGGWNPDHREARHEMSVLALRAL